MNVIDTHCDALVKMQVSKREKNQLLNYKDSRQLTSNFLELQKGEVIVQFFAIFIKPYVPFEKKWDYALEQIDIFHTEIINKNPAMRHIKNWKEIENLKKGEIGAVLTLEGADPFGRNLDKLDYLYRSGILLIGLTWNHANHCGDGAGVTNAGGLTSFGKEVIKRNNTQGVFTDVSHASVKGFWDTIEIAEFLIASHSNVRSICDHPRNLYDDQIISMIDRKGLIHVVYNPPFIKEKQNATISDLIKHIDHLCSLGGVNNIGFGSDFDGIKATVNKLEKASDYQNLINELLKFYSEDEVKGFAYKNFLRHRPLCTNNDRLL
ncbi:dipeptidase [Virgibacillus salexigens]|uniref:dipeptidase n=1 Tax=Virgibacillus TaxID=84406 RepID=UPI0013702576|nr:dipeptidase [Virgibacillus massiliensis]MYL43800.1 membrane dipeptidase [Virgibacillus massiliensis]